MLAETRVFIFRPYTDTGQLRTSSLAISKCNILSKPENLRLSPESERQNLLRAWTKT